jgi:hypothetical protein
MPISDVKYIGVIRSDRFVSALSLRSCEKTSLKSPLENEWKLVILGA